MGTSQSGGDPNSDDGVFNSDHGVFNSDGAPRGSGGVTSSDTLSSAHQTAKLFNTDPTAARVSADARSSMHDSRRAGLVSTGTSQNWNQAWEEE